MATPTKNMTFDVNLLPATTEDHNLGSSTLKWNIYASSININGNKGDLLYWSDNNTSTRLQKGNNGEFLKVESGVPTWSSLPTLPSGSTIGPGIVQLTNTYTSTDDTYAATGQSIAAAINNLDVYEVNENNDAKFIYKISETDGKISASLYSSTIGSETIPIYINNGTITTGTKYAGGTCVTLNGSNTAASGQNISFYAPTGSGTSDYILKSSGSGAAPTWTQYLSVSQGGTGTTSFTANSLIMSGDSTTAALTTKAIDDATEIAQSFSDTNASIPTIRRIYQGLPTINNAHNYTSSTTIYAPTSAGTENQILVSAGGTSAPTWLATAAGAAYASGTNNALTFGTLSVGYGGTGQTSFTSGNVLVGDSDGGITTIVKTSNSTANTIVVRDASRNFATNKITLSTGIDTVVVVNNVETTAPIINIANQIATISSSTINMNYEHYNGDSTVQPAINWYYIKSSLDANNTTIQTNEKIGAMFWSTNNQQAVFQNIFKNPNNNNTLTESYKLPAPTTNATSDGIYDIITTKGMNRGALYAKIPDGGQDLTLNWGTLPIELGGTGVTSLGNIFNKIKGKGLDDDLGDTWWVKKIGDKMSGQLCITAVNNGVNIALSNNNKNAYQLALGTIDGNHLGFDVNKIQAFGYDNEHNSLTFEQLNLNPFGGNISIGNGILTIKNANTRVAFHDGTRDWGIVGHAVGNSNYGLYSDGWLDSTETWHSDGKWLIYRDNTGNSFVQDETGTGGRRHPHQAG